MALLQVPHMTRGVGLYAWPSSVNQGTRRL